MNAQNVTRSIADVDIALLQKTLNEQLDKGYQNSDISNWAIQSDASSRASDMWHYYLVQTHNGVEVRNALANLSVKDNNANINYMQFVKNISLKTNSSTPTISALDAVSKALNHINIIPTEDIKQLSFNTNESVFSRAGVVQSDIKVRLVYEKTNDDKLKLAWNVNLDLNSGKHWWNIRIDASTGAYINKNDWVTTCYWGESEKTHLTHSKTKNAPKESFDFSKAIRKSTTATTSMMAGAYRVLPYYVESPNHGDFELISNPDDAVASPNGWHNDGTAYTTTRGNNVIARDDQDGNNSTSGPLTSQSAAGLVFDYPYGGPGVAASSYIDAATTNAFYMVNIVHDIYYKYGFDEASGNFQENNFGNGGFGGDAVNADVQDGSGTNNANFSTPTDGGNGRMQMFLWNQGAYDPNEVPLLVVNNTVVAGVYSALDNNFDAPGHVLPNVSLTSNLVLADDNIGFPSGVTSDACEALVNGAAINGNIAVIRRGDCSFVSKVVKAQNVGAIAVLVVNNVAGDIFMGGTTIDGTVTIPAYSINMADGEAIIAQMAIETVNATFNEPSTPPPFVNIDGDFDNGVIAHEAGHGINIRLVGGPGNSGCVGANESPGEGWGDFIGKILLLKNLDNGIAFSGTGTFVVGQGPDGIGIRPAPYSGDITNNPMTYETLRADTTNATYTLPHGVGSVWAGMLWDMTWDLIAIHGFNPDIYDSNGTEGNIIALNLVVEGMKLTACGPGFVEARDAILQADQNLYGGANNCAIWGAFARRGLGENATQGSTFSTSDGMHDYTNPAACAPDYLLTIGGATEACVGASLDFDMVFNAQNGYNTATGFTVSGQPGGSVISFSPTTISDTGLVTMNATNLPVGNHTITVTPGGNASKNLVLNITINAPNPVLTDGDTGYSVNSGAYTQFNDTDTVTVAPNIDFDLNLPTAFAGSLLWTAPNGTTYSTDTVNFSNIVDADTAVEGAWTVVATFTNACPNTAETVNFTVVIDPALSVNESKFDNLQTYPNPTSGVLTISSSNNLTKAQVSIYDITGRMLVRNMNKTQVSNNKINIEMSSIASGVYFVTIEDNIYKSTIKIIKE